MLFRALLVSLGYLCHYMITYESCFTGKINTYSCEATMKEYVHGLFTTSGKLHIKLYAAVFCQVDP